MKEEHEIVIISGFLGFAIGVCSMMMVNIDKKVNQIEEFDNVRFTIIENLSLCEDMIMWMNEDIWNERVDSTIYEDYIYNLEVMSEENRNLLK